MSAIKTISIVAILAGGFATAGLCDAAFARNSVGSHFNSFELQSGAGIGKTKFDMEGRDSGDRSFGEKGDLKIRSLTEVGGLRHDRDWRFEKRHDRRRVEHLRPAKTLGWDKVNNTDLSVSSRL